MAKVRTNRDACFTPKILMFLFVSNLNILWVIIKTNHLYFQAIKVPIIYYVYVNSI